MSDVEKSVTQLLNDVKAKNDRLLRNRQAVAFCSAKIPMEEKILTNAIKMIEDYSSTVRDMTASITTLKKRLDFALNYCKEHDDDYEKVKLAEDLAKKIERLQKQLQERRIKLAECMLDTSTPTE